MDPPPSSQHFAGFEGFTPDDAASFDDEFSRLASSQNWVPGSQKYTAQRTIAMREELKQHYFSQSEALSNSGEPTEEEKLKECKRALKSQLINIVDLVNARRTGKEVEVWNDFEAFRDYTLQDEHRIDLEKAKEDGGHLAALLQRLAGPRAARRGRRGGNQGKVRSGRVTKASKTRS